MTKAASSNRLLWLVASGFFMETLDSTIVNTALPSMATSLGESPFLMQSVVIAYSLTIAVLIPASGWVADRFGTRKVFFSAILLFTLGSLCCAISVLLLALDFPNQYPGGYYWLHRQLYRYAGYPWPRQK